MVIDRSDEVGFPMPEDFGAYYDVPRAFATAGRRGVCQHGEAGDCEACRGLKERADDAYREALGIPRALEARLESKRCA